MSAWTGLHARLIQASGAPVAPHVAAELMELTAGDTAWATEAAAQFSHDQLVGMSMLPDPLPGSRNAKHRHGVDGCSSSELRLLRAAAVACSDRISPVLDAAEIFMEDFFAVQLPTPLTVRDGGFVLAPDARAILLREMSASEKMQAHAALERAYRRNEQPVYAAWHQSQATPGERFDARALFRLMSQLSRLGLMRELQYVATTTADAALDLGAVAVSSKSYMIAARAAISAGHLRDAEELVARTAPLAKPKEIADLRRAIEAFREPESFEFRARALREVSLSSADRTVIDQVLRVGAAYPANPEMSDQLQARLTLSVPLATPRWRRIRSGNASVALAPMTEAFVRLSQCAIQYRSGQREAASRTLDDALSRLPIHLAGAGIRSRSLQSWTAHYRSGRARLSELATQLAPELPFDTPSGQASTSDRTCGAVALRSLDNPPVAPQKSEERPPPHLTPREQQVLRQLRTGSRPAEIASELGLSRRTVDNHIASVYRKSGVTSRNQLLRTAGHAATQGMPNVLRERISFALSRLRDEFKVPIAPHVAGMLVGLAPRSDADLLALAEALTPEQLGGMAVIPDPIPLSPRSARSGHEYFSTETSSELHRFLLTAALSVSDRSDVVLAAAEVDIAGLREDGVANLVTFGDGTFSFVRPLVRHLLSSTLSGGEARQVHGALAEAFDAAHEPLFARWHRHLASPSHSQSEELLAVAKELLANGAITAAYSVGLEALNGSPGLSCLSAQLILGRCALVLGCFAEAERRLEQAATSPDPVVASEGAKQLQVTRLFLHGPSDAQDSLAIAHEQIAALGVAAVTRLGRRKAKRIQNLVWGKKGLAAASVEDHTRLYLSAITDRSNWPWETSAETMSPLLEGVLQCQRTGFLIQQGLPGQGVRVLVSAVARLPMTHLLAGAPKAQAYALARSGPGIPNEFLRALDEITPDRFRLLVSLGDDVGNEVGPPEPEQPEVPYEMQPLTPRETEVRELALLGLANRDIAKRLGISHRTVEVHLRRIYKKQGLTSRSALIQS